MERFRGFFYACMSAATFGMIPLFVNRAILDGVNNDTILVYRYTLAALIYGVFLFCRKTNLRISRRELKEVALAGVGGYGITAFFLFLSYHYMPTGIATSIHYLYPVVVAVFMAVFYRERLSLVVKAAIMLAIVGVAFLSWSEGRIQWMGLVFILLSTVTYGVYIVALNRPVLKKMDPSVLTFWVLSLSALFYILLAFSRGTFHFSTEPSFWFDMTMLGVFSTVVSARLLVSAVKLIGSVSTSVLGTLEPITAILIGILVFHESFRMFNFIGFCMVVAAVLVVIVYTNNAGRRKLPEEDKNVTS